MRARRWLAGQGDERGAQRAMRALAEPREAARELAEMSAQARGRRDTPGLRQLLRAPALRRQLTLGAPHLAEHGCTCRYVSREAAGSEECATRTFELSMSRVLCVPAAQRRAQC